MWLDEHEGWNRTLVAFQKSIPLAEVSLVSEKRKLIHHTDLSKVIAIIAVATASSFFCYLICFRVKVRASFVCYLIRLRVRVRASFFCYFIRLVLPPPSCAGVSTLCFIASCGIFLVLGCLIWVLDRCTRTAVETEKSSSHFILCFSQIV